MENKFDLITIGDSTVDTFIKIHDATVECDINHQDCKICVKYGDKIPVDTIAHEVAGNAANVAVACSKIGLKTAIYTNLGDDDHGKSIKATFERQGVSQDYVVVNHQKESNLSVILTFQGERTIFVYHQDWSYELPKLDNASWIYLTSMAETFTQSRIMDEIVNYLERTGAKLVFSPGTYQLKADVKRYQRLLEKCQVLIINLEEAKKILGIQPADMVDVDEIFAKLLQLGPRSIVITDGTEGSYATDGNRNFKLGIFPTKVIEKTGAGDAYSSGLLSALHLGKTFSEAMVWGTINAGHVIGQIGPMRGLLTREEIIKHKKENKDLIAVNF